MSALATSQDTRCTPNISNDAFCMTTAKRHRPSNTIRPRIAWADTTMTTNPLMVIHPPPYLNNSAEICRSSRNDIAGIRPPRRGSMVMALVFTPRDKERRDEK
ncbi:hypothetical protein SAPIO_CDS2537 [Scedosporium apiospermum]|uniref:Uncharacterized protein n=1 Tax=Pseudallescheria apiosperma TaxID=563466 RepID=A0A084GCP3_PSEDA|nr:uncharacterized protein SAPIO_CDS2537 [Scedosporium apiospermum]KEZ45105.1 hypothetical protein SAPIO_CDS2537 [Scedosporium apiospermum]